MKSLYLNFFFLALFSFSSLVFASTSNQKWFLAANADSIINVKNASKDDSDSLNETAEEIDDSNFSEAEIEEGEPGCFTRSVYGNVVKGFGSSFARVNCPNPSTYQVMSQGCKVLGNGIEISTYSKKNLQHCSSQGKSLNDYHKVVAYIQCCSIY